MANVTRQRLLYLVAFMDMFVCTLIVPVLMPHMRMNGASLLTIGVVTSLYLALQLISSPFIRRWSGMRGHHSVLQITLPICAVSYFILGTARFIPLIFLCRIVLGLSEHTQTLCKTLLAKEIPQPELQKRLASAGALSLVVVPAIAGNMMEIRNGYQYVCCIITVLCFINFGIVHFLLPQAPQQGKKEKNEPSKSSEKETKQTVDGQSAFSEIQHSLTDLLKVDWQLYWDVLALKFLFDFSLGAHLQTFAPILHDVYGTKARWIGYTFMIQGVASGVSSFLTELISKLPVYRDDKQNIHKIRHGFAIFTLSFLGLSIAPNWFSIIVCLVPLSVSGSFLRTATTQMIEQRTSLNKRGSGIGAQSIFSVARLCAPVVTGMVFDNYGFWGTSLLKVTSAGLASALTFSLLVSKKEKEKKEE